MSYQNFIGCDISKEWIDVAVEKKSLRIHQTEKDLKKFIQNHILPLHNVLVIFESTGGHEKLLESLLRDVNISFHKAHPNKVFHFAKANSRLAKTDKIDAKILKEYGEIMKCEATKPRSEKQMYLSSIQSRLAQLKALHQEERCRLQAPYLDKVSKKSIQTVLKCLENQIEKLEEEAKNITQSDQELAKKSALLQSVPGIGKKISSVLLGLMPELGIIENKSIAALAGLAPITKESGKKKGYASIGTGRIAVRKAMYMAALVAMSHNKKMKTFYQKLIEKGKKPKVALIAVARKMLTILNTLVKKGISWQENNEINVEFVRPSSAL
jgi:transposase